MSSVQIKSSVTVNDLIGGVEQLSNQDLDSFINNILSIRAKRKSAKLDKEESHLMEKINEFLPKEEFERYKVLIRKRDNKSLTEIEHGELIAFSDKIELIHAERISALAKLANLRGVTLDEIMKELEIRPRNV